MPSFPDTYSCWVCNRCPRPCYVVRDCSRAFNPERCIYEPRGDDRVAHFEPLTWTFRFIFIFKSQSWKWCTFPMALEDLVIQAVLTSGSSFAGTVVFWVWFCPNHRCCQMPAIRKAVERTKE